MCVCVLPASGCILLVHVAIYCIKCVSEWSNVIMVSLGPNGIVFQSIHITLFPEEQYITIIPTVIRIKSSCRMYDDKTRSVLRKFENCLQKIFSNNLYKMQTNISVLLLRHDQHGALFYATCYNK